tara:strand:- start:10275 stop:11261 length:987 start_codon:yes stop_codon:yes gene_type:complete
MSSFKIGTVQRVLLKDDNVNQLYCIEVLTSNSQGIFEKVYPADSNIKRIPLVGESVLVFTGLGPEASGGSRRAKQYYFAPTAVQLNVHNNALPKGAITKKSKGGTDTESAQTGNPNTSGGDEEADLGKGFTERTDIGSLQPFIGDVLLEGRFGHSLRFGYTPNGADTTKQPTWGSLTDNDPITILANGRKRGGKYNKFIIEDIDDDLSSIYLTSSQTLQIKTSQTNLGSAGTHSSYSNPTVTITSDRILLNAREDYVVLSGKKDVIVATKKWAVDMDKMFTLIKDLATELNNLTSASATFATGVGPTGPATNASEVLKITEAIEAMKQ